MEGKVVIMSALLVSLVVVLGQIQVEAKVSDTIDAIGYRGCCQNPIARGVYDRCVATQRPWKFCAALAGCELIRDDQVCVVNDILENTVNELPVEAKVSYTMEDPIGITSCCPNATARARYDVCRATPPICAGNAGCILIFPGIQTCPSDYPYHMLKNTVNEYCKLGCVSSVCGAITTLQNSDASEVVNGAVEKCSNACSDFCTKGSITTAVETA